MCLCVKKEKAALIYFTFLTYVFQEFFTMLLEYMQRRAQIETPEFEDIVEQNIDDEMATRKVIKTMFEVREEKGELKGLRKAIFFALRTTSLTDAQIALELETDESFVKKVRQEFLAAQQQG